MAALTSSVFGANVGSNYVSPGMMWNIGERLEAQDPRQVARIQASAQQQAAYQQSQAQREAARLQADTARRQAELQFEAQMAPQRFKERAFAQIFGGGGLGTPGDGRVSIQPFPGPGGGGQGFLNIPGRGVAGPPGIPGSVLAPPASSIPGASPPMQGGGFGGFFGGGGGPIGSYPIDTTLPQFSSSPFSTARERQDISAARAGSGRQLATEQKNIAEQGAARGFSGSSPQIQAMQSQARQASRAGQLGQAQDIRQQYGQARSGLEMQQQGLLSQARRGISSLYPEFAKAEAARQSPLLGLLGNFLG